MSQSDDPTEHGAGRRWLILLVGLSPGLRVPEQVSSYSPAHDLPLQVAVAR